MKYTSTLLSSLFIPGLFFLAACSGGQEPEAAASNKNIIPVTIAIPSGHTTDAVMASGQVEAVQTAAISTRIMGTITRIYVKTGDKVSRGQVLATISSNDLLARRAQADAMIAGAAADLENARKDYDRFSNLFSRQSATASELDNATLRYNAAKSRLEAAQQTRNEVNASISYTRLTAPFAGVVTQKTADEGSMASPGMPLLTIEQNSLLRVSATVAESDIRLIRAGDKALLEIKAGGGKAEGVITQLSPSAASTGGQYVVKISLPAAAQKNVYAGMYVNVSIPVKNAVAMDGDQDHEAILVPASALVQNDQLTGLYTISSEHTALLRWVRTGKTYGDKTVILSGLGKDEPFIVSAAGKLYNGAPVQAK